MSDPAAFMNQYIADVKGLIDILEDLRTLNDRVTQDATNPTMVTRYFSSQGARTDITSSDFTAAQAAIVQLLFAFDSGAPTQKAALFKLL